MIRSSTLLIALLGAGLCRLGACQLYETIQSDNGMGWRGEPGYPDYCTDSSTGPAYAYALQFKFETLDKVDNTGGNSVKFFCKDTSNVITNYVTSFEGRYGDWLDIYTCPDSHYINGFRLRVFPDQGTFGDDFAVDDIQVTCSDGTIMDGQDGIIPPSAAHYSNPETSEHREKVEVDGRVMEAVRVRLSSSPERETRLNGEWGSFAYCSPGMRVAGLKTTVEEGHISDDAGLTDVTLYCI